MRGQSTISLCEDHMPFSIRSYRRFPTQCFLTRAAGHNAVDIVLRYRHEEGTASALLDSRTDCAYRGGITIRQFLEHMQPELKERQQ
jgi:hypothetical protein